MSNGQNHPTTLWAVIGICATVAVTSATGGWIVARAYLADELDQIRRAKEWRLPENLAELGTLSKTVALQLHEKQELERLRKEVPAISSQMTAAKQRVRQLEEAEKQLAERLRNLQGDTFEIKEGESRFIVPHRLALGVTYVSSAGHSVNVQLGTRSESLEPGEPIETVVDGKRYIITFVHKNEYSTGALFSVDSVTDGKL
jgi:hypothetical protein